MATVPAHLVDDPRWPRLDDPILLVEDDPQVRAVLAILLEGEGLSVATAADGWEAIQWTRTHRPSLVLLDIGLPLVDGLKVGSVLRSSYGPRLPILVITAGGGPASTAEQVEAYGYLTKPFDVDDLLALVWRGLHCQ